MIDEPWQIFLEEFRRRAGDVPERAFTPDADLAEAAHVAYEETIDLLVDEHGYTEKEALGLAKAFNRTVKDWIQDAGFEWTDLRERLEAKQQDWELEGEVSA